ncbi:MAG: DsbA family protein [Campylobacteraceae bacterium]|jgi:protein-disulfide isomerase|nr:DsbA family protein [Campylobacteraceae bacterium]
MKFISAALLILTLLMGAAAYWYKSKTDEKTALAVQTLLVRDYSHWNGAEDAKVVLVEFFDPACETCAQFYPLVKNLIRVYEGRLKVVSRYAPLHKNSDAVVSLLEALREQDKFEEALEILFKNQSIWVKNHTSQFELAASLLNASGSVDINRAFGVIESEEVLKHVQQDIADGKALGVTMTPEFFVNGRRLEQFGYNELVKLIEEEMKKAEE